VSTPLNLAEQLQLLALDEKGAGRAGWGTGIGTGLAGALLPELAAEGCLAEEGGRLVPAGCDAPGDPLLRDALDVVRGSDRPRRAASWIRGLPRTLRPLRRRAAERLVAQGVLAEERRRLLGALRRTRLPEVDPGPEAALRERLGEVLTGAAEPAPREAMPIALMEPHDLVGKVVAASSAAATSGGGGGGDGGG
jgi:hypothetical protein